jgi:hypothetical protein
MEYNKLNPNDPINPIITENEYEGLSKREYFASIAMQGLISDRPADDIYIPKRAVKIADGLIKELNKTKSNGK